MIRKETKAMLIVALVMIVPSTWVKISFPALHNQGSDVPSL